MKHRFFFAAALILILLGGGSILMDWMRYHQTLHSAPFRIFILVRCVEFLLPAALCGAIGLILRRRHRSG